MIAALLIPLIILGLPTLYFAWHSREFRKFLAGTFFVSAGILFYLYLTKVSVPLLGTSLVLTPEISGFRSIVMRLTVVLSAMALLPYFALAKRSAPPRVEPAIH